MLCGDARGVAHFLIAKRAVPAGAAQHADAVHAVCDLIIDDLAKAPFVDGLAEHGVLRGELHCLSLIRE
jgi:hypothetical protein